MSAPIECHIGCPRHPFYPGATPCEYHQTDLKALQLEARRWAGFEPLEAIEAESETAGQNPEGENK